MENEKTQKPRKTQEGREPDYTGNGVAVWVNPDKTDPDKRVLAIKIVGHDYIYAFKNEPKPRVFPEV